MDKQELLRKYLDDELSASEEKEALHLIADDPDLRSSLRFELFLRQSFSDTSFDRESFEVPHGFSDKVMMEIDRLEEKPLQTETSDLATDLLSWIRSVFTPREYELRPAMLAFAVTLIILLPVLSFYLGQPGSDLASQNNEQAVPVQTVSEELVWVRFIYVDENANNIAIAGDFNNWEPHPLTEQQINGEDVWTGFFAMPRGENKYMFVVNGEKWVTDPLANMYQDDGFGNKNAIIYL